MCLGQAGPAAWGPTTGHEPPLLSSAWASLAPTPGAQGVQVLGHPAGNLGAVLLIGLQGALITAMEIRAGLCPQDTQSHRLVFSQTIDHCPRRLAAGPPAQAKAEQRAGVPGALPSIAIAWSQLGRVDRASEDALA